MSSGELRKKFLKFFEVRGHVIVPSSSLIPDDPSVLLTTAGMQQFKPYYTGELDPMTAIHGTRRKPLGSKNAASIQKSFRTSDIEGVGDESHLTFFEMLGNFSFGGYFKREAIEWAWEFIHHALGVPLERVRVSVFAGDAEVPFDQESHDIWKSLGMPDGKIAMGGREDNFWGPTGNEGPCGPTTEIYVDGVETWNIVFNEHYMRPDKSLEPLKIKGVDTGMGFERLALVMQYPAAPHHTIFATDLFRSIIDAIAKQSSLPYTLHPIPYRIIADHMRASVFLIADGVRPSNIEQGYILRRLLRRAARYAHLLNMKSGWYDGVVRSVVDIYRSFYPEVSESEEMRVVIAAEYEKFEKALAKGLREFQKFAAEGALSGKNAFDLYQNYGFPPEMIEELGSEQGIAIDRAAFDQEFKKHQEISKAGLEQKFGGHGLAGVSDEDARKDPAIWKMTRLHTATHLMHQALRDVLGSSVRQMGSDINPERTRFDFTFDRKVAADELKRIEDVVNQKIGEDLPVRREMLSYEEAIRGGALAFFREKYPEIVSVYSIGPSAVNASGRAYSRELCGGPHVSHTSEIGRFKIAKEEAVAAGTRRIRGVVEGAE